MRKISRYFIAALVIFAVFCIVSVAQHWDVVTATLASSMNSLFSTGLYKMCIRDRAKEKLRSRKETTVIVTICICCFLISFGLFSSMRISTRAMLKESSNLEETTQTAAGETEEPASKTEGPASETEEVDESDNS